MDSINLRLSSGHNSNTSIASSNQSLGVKPALTSTGTASVLIPQNSFVLGVLFDNITSSESMAEVPEYRCIYVENTASTGATPFLNAKIYVSGNTYAKFALGKVQSKNIDASVVSNETMAPALITFQEHTKDNKLVLGDLQPGDRYAVWIRRTPQNIGGAGSTQESLDIVIEGSQ